MPMQTTKRGAAALLAGALLAGPALAQTAAPPSTGTSAAAPTPQGQPQDPTKPVKVELKTYDKTNWIKICPTMQPGAKQMCFTTRDFTVAQDQPPLVALAVYEVKGDESRDVRILLPTALLLKPGVRMSVDKGAMVEGAYTMCLQNGCFAESRVKGSFLDQVKKGTTLNVVVKGPANNEITFALPISGFGAAFDGPAVPQEVIAKQQAEQQAELQKQLQERAQAQRQALEKAAGTAPGSAPTTPTAPGAAPAAPAAKP